MRDIHFENIFCSALLVLQAVCNRSLKPGAIPFGTVFYLVTGLATFNHLAGTILVTQHFKRGKNFCAVF